MREEAGDIWKLAEGRALCITTNPIINADGKIVMGRGIALQAKERFPALPIALAARVRASGNRPYDLGTWVYQNVTYRIFSLPTKYDWKHPADISLIRSSLLWLSDLVEGSDVQTPIYLPRPGCGNGKLSWGQVRPLCLSLPDRFVVVDYQESQRNLL